VNIFQGHNTYLYLNILTILGPLLLSFDKKVAFYKDWKYFLYAMLPTSLAYIIWDIIATKTMVWKFNGEFLLGINVVNLPIEEYIFFLVVPYACLFIYACLKAYWPHWHSPKLNTAATSGIVALIPMAFVNGILTANPVLIYDDAENLGIRIGTIPFEDFFYNLLYMTWMITLFELFKTRQSKPSLLQKN
jgi:lycopene cyclase domain-containing protein